PSTYFSRPDLPLSPDQGFSDGFYTAKLFALYGRTGIDYIFAMNLRAPNI
ncbi:hypothetical protein MPER_02100, partial [Moniliophthora perniciosa FA553]